MLASSAGRHRGRCDARRRGDDRTTGRDAARRCRSPRARSQRAVVAGHPDRPPSRRWPVAVRPLAAPQLAEGRTGDRTDRRRTRDDADPVRHRRADGGDGARPGIPARSVAVHPQGQPHLPAQPRPHSAQGRSRAVQQPGNDGRLCRRRRCRPTVSASCRSASMSTRADAAEIARVAAAVRPAGALPAVRRHRRAPQEPARACRGGLVARRAAAADRRRRRRLG